MYKVFIENKAVLFISDDSQMPINRTLYIYRPKDFTYKEVRKKRRRIRKEIILIIKTKDVELAWKTFRIGLRKVVAAGGLVENANREYLLIFRNRRWDLPKGKLKKNENKRLGAIREIEEECGVNKLFIKKKMTITYHVVNQKGEFILKKVHWYKLTCGYKGVLTPQIQEGITKVEWTTKKKAARRFRNSWGTIREVMEAAKVVKRTKIIKKPTEILVPKSKGN